ncbi:PGPGW domain-containing protein [Azospirillum sp. sgz302134]
MHRPAASARTPSLARLRQLALIGTGWTIIGLGVLIAPLPGPGGLPVVLIGGAILLRNSSDARRLFVRMKRRHPRLFHPVERIRVKLRRRRFEGRISARAD